MANPPSVKQYQLNHADQELIIVEVGGGIRSYRREGTPVFQDYPLGAMCDGAHGAPLIPWPNRLSDGRYRFDGTDYQVALTEPEKQNAIHGLLRWQSWSVRKHAANQLTMGVRLHPTPGYPFALYVHIEYRLGRDGLTVTTTAANTGDQPCPYGSGQHPYLSPGDDTLIDDCHLQLPAATRILTSADRQLPTGTEPVAGTAFDFREPRRLGQLRIDDAFTDLARDDDGRAWVRLRRPDGRTAQLWVDRTYPVIEVFTADTLAPDRRRRGLGSEPMTCPPNAFHTGQLVNRLQPAQAITTAWGAQLIEPTSLRPAPLT